MIFSKKTFEGFICIDHSESPGFTQADRALRGSVLPFAGAGQKFQAATNTCSHCERVVIRNPDRTRPRGHCSKCDRFMCDPCSADFYLTSECRCWEKRANDYLAKIMKGVS